MISTSEIKVSCVIDAKYTELAVRALHTAFGLDKARGAVARAAASGETATGRARRGALGLLGAGRAWPAWRWPGSAPALDCAPERGAGGSGRGRRGVRRGRRRPPAPQRLRAGAQAGPQHRDRGGARAAARGGALARPARSSRRARRAAASRPGTRWTRCPGVGAAKLRDPPGGHGAARGASAPSACGKHRPCRSPAPSAPCSTPRRPAAAARGRAGAVHPLQPRLHGRCPGGPPAAHHAGVRRRARAGPAGHSPPRGARRIGAPARIGDAGVRRRRALACAPPRCSGRGSRRGAPRPRRRRARAPRSSAPAARGPPHAARRAGDAGVRQRARGAPAPPRASTQVFGVGWRRRRPAPRARRRCSAARPREGGSPPRASHAGVRQCASVAVRRRPRRASSTQVFGSAGASSEAPPRASTQVFGSAAQPAASGRRRARHAGLRLCCASACSTQVFGAPADRNAAGRARPLRRRAARASTQVFGAAPGGGGRAAGCRTRARSAWTCRRELLAERRRACRVARSQPARRAPGCGWCCSRRSSRCSRSSPGARCSARGPAFPLEAVSARDSAATLLRRDDARSRQQALAELERVLKAHPDFLEARAELAVALALELDDVRWSRRCGARRRAARSASASRWRARRAPRAGRSRRAAAPRSRPARQGGVEQLEARVQQLTARAEEALRGLEPEGGRRPRQEEQRARMRAQALLGAVQGAPGSMARAEQLRADGSGQGWDVIAEAEYVLNAPASSLGPTGAQRPSGAGGAAPARRRLPAHLRARRPPGARAGERGARRALLDMAVALNPTHELARTPPGARRAASSTARDATALKL